MPVPALFGPTVGVPPAGQAEEVKDPEPLSQIVIPVVTGDGFTAITLLLDPVIEGLLDLTRIRYPLPEAVPTGIVALMVPEFASLTNVPIVAGDANEPEELDSSAV